MTHSGDEELIIESGVSLSLSLLNSCLRSSTENTENNGINYVNIMYVGRTIINWH